MRSTGAPAPVRHRSWLAVGIATLLALVAAALLARTLAQQRALQRALPRVDGRMAVAGIQAPVTIYRDGHGVPHILARSERDAWFGLGFVEAQDRLAQLVFLQRTARGRLAEVLGPKGLESDRWSRTLGFGRLARAELAALDKPERAAFEAFAAGISAWVEEVRSGRAANPLPLERLGIQPEPWAPDDSLAVAKLVAWGLDGSIDATLVLSDLIEKLGGFGARPFFPSEAARALREPSSPDTERKPPVPVAWHDPLRTALGLAGRSVGSSAWVIGARDTQSGAPLVAGDLHLAPRVPSLLYECHLAAPQLEVAGAGIAGVPGLWSGHNEHVAWATTHARAVATDLYLETLDTRDPRRYRVGTALRPLSIRSERIRVRGRPDVELTVRATHHGPLVQDLLPAGRPPLAVAWGGAQPDGSAGALLRAMHARDAAEFRAALAAHRTPVWVVVYADTAGHGGRQVVGWLPNRSMATGLVPVPGRSQFYDWRGRLDPAALPSADLGATGAIVASDQQIAAVGGRIEWWWRPGERAARLDALLRAARTRGPIGSRVVAGILTDQMSADSPARVRSLLDLAGEPETLPPEARTVAQLLREWDGSVSEGSVGAAAWHVLLHAVLEAVLAPPLGADLAHRYLALRGTSPQALLDAILAEALAPEPPADAFVDAYGLRTAVRESLRRTGLALRVDLGPNAERWHWGELHELHFDPFGWPARAWRAPGADPRFPYGGDGVTIAVAEYDPVSPYDVRVASTWRWIVDLASPEIALSSLVPGATEHPGDPLRFEGVERWRAGRPGVLATHRFLIEDGARARLVLEPRS